MQTFNVGMFSGYKQNMLSSRLLIGRFFAIFDPNEELALWIDIVARASQAKKALTLPDQGKIAKTGWLRGKQAGW